MKIKFEANLEYQNNAVDSVVDIFRDTSLGSGVFTNEFGGIFSTAISNNFSNNDFDKEKIQANLKQIQLNNNLNWDEFKLDFSQLEFDVEMETGTGKTYVFIKTILELNKNYNLKKFIIVVPSIAIKEGISKTFEITKEHFKAFYTSINYHYHFYNDKKDIDNFIRSNELEILIINIQSFNKATNILNNEDERGYKYIDILKQTKPVIIIDEPQSTKGDKQSKSYNAIINLDPIFILNYSATYRESTRSNLVYCLNAIKAYEKNLVKKIKIASYQLLGNENQVVIELDEIKADKNNLFAKIKINCKYKEEIKKESIWVEQNDDLFLKSKKYDIYSNYIVDNISNEENMQYISFTNGKIVELKGKIGGLDRKIEETLRINKTIETHLDLQLELLNKDIKVLSLFFIDKVKRYRNYEDNKELKGEIAIIFESEFLKLIKKDKYKILLEKLYHNENVETLKSKVHNGYFSIDKNNHYIDTSERIKKIEDEKSYNLIMRDKEKLLSFDKTLSFIFSHSALKEGWDNPNVFQICTLNQTKSEMKKHQEIGRGLRLCVNQKGNRILDPNLNILTVFVNENYEEFVSKLQKELEENQNIKSGFIKLNTFTNIKWKDNELVGIEGSKFIFNKILEKKYIDKKGKILAKYYEDYDNNKIDFLDDKLNIIKEAINKKIWENNNFNKIKISNKLNEKNNTLNKKIIDSKKFQNLFNKINYKSFFKINFDSEKFFDACFEAIAQINFEYSILDPKVEFRIDQLAMHAKNEQNINNISISNTSKATKKIELEPEIINNFIDLIEEKTQITTKTIARLILKLLKEKNHLVYIKRNIFKYTKIVSEKINTIKNKFCIDQIEYYVKKNHRFDESIFNSNITIEENDNEKSSNLFIKEVEEKDLDKVLYKYIQLDSNAEIQYLDEALKHESLDLIIKLPKTLFYINTPEGKYTPDFALNKNSNHYWIVEIKGSSNKDDLKTTEENKINCLKKYIEYLNKIDKDLIDKKEFLNERFTNKYEDI